jgi:hypothetical protein
MFNVLDTNEGDKVDFWMLTEEPFDAARFARRRAERIGDLEVFVSRPEGHDPDEAQVGGAVGGKPEAVHGCAAGLRASGRGRWIRRTWTSGP